MADDPRHQTTRWQSFAAIRAFATDAQIQRAAIRWCGEKDRETFPEDEAYFRHNWWALPGLLAYVQREVESDTLRAILGEALALA